MDVVDLKIKKFDHSSNGHALKLVVRNRFRSNIYIKLPQLENFNEIHKFNVIDSYENSDFEEEFNLNPERIILKDQRYDLNVRFHSIFFLKILMFFYIDT